MKKLVLLAAVLVSTFTMADICKVEMVSQSGRVIDFFTAYDYNTPSACREALRICKYEQRRRGSYDRVVRNAVCTPERRRPNPSKETCSFKLVRNNGNIVDTFTSQARDKRVACQRAEDKCFNARYERNNPSRFSCEKSNSRRDRRQVVTRYCSVDRIGNGHRGGRVLQTYTKSSTGYEGTGVRASACEKAKTSCARDARYSGRRDTCVMSR